MHPYLGGRHPRAMAHRGWHTGDLAGCENTLAALAQAAAEGYDYVETDARATAASVKDLADTLSAEAERLNTQVRLFLEDVQAA